MPIQLTKNHIAFGAFVCGSHRQPILKRLHTIFGQRLFRMRNTFCSIATTKPYQLSQTCE